MFSESAIDVVRSNPPVIILAGGLGTRIMEETEDKPKPMVLIGNKPILWHIMKIYASQGYNEFIIATGYKHLVIDNWVHENNSHDSWGFECSVTSHFTGEASQTAGRVRQVLESFPNENFFLTYGDGVGNVNLRALYAFHKRHGKKATVTSVRPPARFGVITSSQSLVTHFGEKNQVDAGWINGGFFVIERTVSGYIRNDLEPFEQGPMLRLVDNRELMTYEHHGFWQPMDTLREKQILDALASEEIPVWLRTFE